MTMISRYFTDYRLARKCLARGVGRKLIPLADGRYKVTWMA